MNTGNVSTDELHLCNSIPVPPHKRGMEQMGHMSTESRATDPELDDALARAIRQLIAEAMDAGSAPESTA